MNSDIKATLFYACKCKIIMTRSLAGGKTVFYFEIQEVKPEVIGSFYSRDKTNDELGKDSGAHAHTDGRYHRLKTGAASRFLTLLICPAGRRNCSGNARLQPYRTGRFGHVTQKATNRQPMTKESL